MRTLVLRVFDYSLDGIIGEEDTGFFEFCRQAGLVDRRRR